jgi:hypothetical protein
MELADHVMEGEVNMGGQEHFYLETHAVLAVPKGEDDEIELFVSTQIPTMTQVCYYPQSNKHPGMLLPRIHQTSWYAVSQNQMPSDSVFYYSESKRDPGMSLPRAQCTKTQVYHYIMY